MRFVDPDIQVDAPGLVKPQVKQREWAIYVFVVNLAHVQLMTTCTV